MSKCYIGALLMWNAFLFACAMPAKAQVELAWERSYDFGGYAVPAPAIDDSGNVYVTTQAPDGVGVLKYDAGGNLVYADVWVPGVTATPLGIGADSLGNAYIVGTTDPSTDQADIFVVKYDTLGGAAWYQFYDQEDLPDEALAMVVDNSGNIYISGIVTVTRDEYDPYQRWILLKYDRDGNEMYNHLHTHPDCVNEYQNCGWTAEYDMDFIVLDGERNSYSVSGALGMTPMGTYPYVASVSSSSGGMTSSGALDCETLGDWIRIRAEGLAVDQEGNAYVSMWWYLNPDEGNCLKKLDSTLTAEEWSVEQDHVHKRLLTDSQGYLYMTSGGAASSGPLHKIDPEDGSELCTFPGPYFYGLDHWDNLYVNGTDGYLVAFDSECNQLWSDDGLPSGGRSVVFDKWGDIYMTWLAYGEVRVAKYTQEKVLFIKDGSEDNDSIPNTDFRLIRISDDPDPFTEEDMGEFTTNAAGKLFLEPIGGGLFYFENNDQEVHTLGVGDIIKVEKFVFDSAAVKHKSVLGTMYSVFLDNAKFNPEGGMCYEELTIGSQDIIMDHTELRFNLLVSVEWDAAVEYLTSMERGFKSVSSHLYDVTDGQARLDTVKIFDSKVHWDSADMRIHASNILVADAHPGGIHWPNEADCRIAMPRKNYFYASEDRMRNTSFDEYQSSGELNLNQFGDFACKDHELGHYAFQFGDENRSNPPAENWRCDAQQDYGYMDGGMGDHLLRTQDEMSSDSSYSYEDCRNTDHWKDWEKSCWGVLEHLFEDSACGEEEIFVPIIIPGEREERGELPEGDSLFPGPDEIDLAQHIGNLVEFPTTQLPPAAGKALVMVWDENGQLKPKAKVSLIKGYGGDLWGMYQGKTADAGGIYVVGKEAGDKVWVQGDYHVHELINCSNPTLGQAEWYYGEITLDASDSFSVELRPVEGDYPLVCGIDLDLGAATYWLNISQLFSEDPTLKLLPDGGTQHPYTFYFDGSGYSADVTDSLRKAGSFTVNALDDSSFTFFFTTDYTVAETGDTAISQLLGPDGQSEVTFDTLNVTIQRALLLTSPYPVIPTGLDTSAMQGGETHCLSIYPSSSLLGDNLLTISYAESDVVGPDSLNHESSLQIYRWNETQWELVGGYVDTALDFVSTLIAEPGVYGAFAIPTIIRGDANGDGVIDVADVMFLINYLFTGTSPPDPLYFGDANCDGAVDVADVMYLINYLFTGTSPPGC